MYATRCLCCPSPAETESDPSVPSGTRIQLSLRPKARLHDFEDSTISYEVLSWVGTRPKCIILAAVIRPCFTSIAFRRSFMSATRGGGVKLNLNGDSILEHSAKTLLHTGARDAEDEGQPRPSRFGIAAFQPWERMHARAIPYHWLDADLTVDHASGRRVVSAVLLQVSTVVITCFSTYCHVRR